MGDYDAVIVGAGPGGSAAAWFLARSGRRVAVLDKKRFPRPKTCGDGLTPRAVKILEEMELGARTGTYRRARGLKVHGGGRTMHLDFPKLSDFSNYGLVRTRKDLDSDIAKAAADAGADFFMGYEAKEPVFEGRRISAIRWVVKEKSDGGGVQTIDEGTVSAPFTIVADGASSPFGRAMGLRRDPSYPLGLAIRTYYRSDLTNEDYFESWLSLRKDGVGLPGYGWLFPVGDGTVNVGVGLLSTFGRWREVNLNRLQDDFVDMIPASYGVNRETQTEKYQSGRLPMGGSLLKPCGEGWVAIGDAAGSVNPFNGEGIAYALETGKLAARLVDEALSTGSSGEMSDYREALHDIYGAYFRLGRKFTKIIGNPAVFQAIVAIGMQSKALMSLVFQVLANLGDRTGGGFGDRVLRALVRIAEKDLDDLPDPEIPGPSLRIEQKARAR